MRLSLSLRHNYGVVMILHEHVYENITIWHFIIVTKVEKPTSKQNIRLRWDTSSNLIEATFLLLILLFALISGQCVEIKFLKKDIKKDGMKLVKKKKKKIVIMKRFHLKTKFSKLFYLKKYFEENKLWKMFKGRQKSQYWSNIVWIKNLTRRQTTNRTIQSIDELIVTYIVNITTTTTKF